MKIFHRIYLGQTLLGLILSIALSSFLLIVIIQFYQHSQQQNRQALLRLQLQMEIQRAIQTMAKDIRRAGFRAISSKVSNTNFSLFELDEQGTSLALYPTNLATIGIARKTAVQNNCVLFFYDLDGNACLGSTNRQCVDGINGEQNRTSELGRELFGYRHKGNLLESRTYGNKANNRCRKAECQRYLQAESCEDTGWSKVLDEDRYDVTYLNFQWLENPSDYKAIQIELAGRVKQVPHIEYETQIVVPLLNQEMVK